MEKICQKIQYERRFFFALPQKEEAGEKKNWLRDREEFPPLGVLHEIVKLAEDFDMVQTLPAGTTFFRARPCAPDGHYQTAQELGPPPPDRAVQANRMNPPGIPMMYGAETEHVAVRETRSSCVTVGRFQLEREARILDLADLPEIPGIFSGVERRTRLGLIFVHAFAREIARPVDRTDRIHIDYIPSQVVTEFIRDAKISGSPVDGIRYPSTLDPNGRNLVLFATQDDLMEPDGTPVSTQHYPPPAPWIRLLDAHLVEALVA
jgi:RES domain-containing protein